MYLQEEEVKGRETLVAQNQEKVATMKDSFKTSHLKESLIEVDNVQGQVEVVVIKVMVIKVMTVEVLREVHRLEESNLDSLLTELRDRRHLGLLALTEMSRDIPRLQQAEMKTLWP